MTSATALIEVLGRHFLVDLNAGVKRPRHGPVFNHGNMVFPGHFPDFQGHVIE